MKASAWLLVAGLCLAHATVCYGSPKVTMGRSGHAHRGVRRRGLKATVPAKPKTGLDLLSPANALLLFGTVLTNLGQDFPEGRQSSTPLLGSTTIQDAVNSITSQYSDLQTALTSGTVQPQAPFCTFWGAGRLAQNIVGSVPTSGPLATALLSTPAVQYVTNTIGAVRPNAAATIDNGCAAYMPADGETFSGYLTRAVGDAPVVQALSGAIQPLEAYIAQTNATIPSLSNFLNTYNTSSSIIPSLVGVGANLGFPWPTGLGTGNLMTQWFAPVSNLLTGARTNTVKTTNAKPPSPPSPPAPATGVFKDLYNAIVGYNATSKLFT